VTPPDTVPPSTGQLSPADIPPPVLYPNRVVVLFCLIIAGEAIFALPFNITRFFRPSFLEVYGLNNAMLGDAFAVYGITAMLSYFPGGLLADRFSPRKLVTASLLATAVGGIYLFFTPSPLGLSLLFGYWGVTTILLFWAALIRATRDWGRGTQQGLAFGFLDGGRGLVAAAAASAAVWLFASLVGPDTAAITDVQRARGMQGVVVFYSLMTVAAALMCWLLIPESPDEGPGRQHAATRHVREVLGKPVVWLQAGIVVCAYCGYKGLDNYGLYAVQVLGMDEVEAARFTAIGAYLRPLGAIAAGLIADRFNARSSILVLFLVLAASYGGTALASGQAPATALIANLVVSYLAVYALRGIYFALLAETSIATHATGTAVGVISVIGYTPDIFFAPIAGRLLDQSPGLVGHQHYFLLLTGIACAGLLVSLALSRVMARLQTSSS
jgi:nitrate/nitrite transporter NarK